MADIYKIAKLLILLIYQLSQKCLSVKITRLIVINTALLTELF